MTAVALISQGLGSMGDPSSPRLMVVLPLIGGGLAVASVVRHRRRHQPSPLAEIASSMVEGLTCAVVGFWITRTERAAALMGALALPRIPKELPGSRKLLKLEPLTPALRQKGFHECNPHDPLGLGPYAP